MKTDNFKRLQLTMILFFVLILIFFELIIGLIFVSSVSKQIETARQFEFQQSLEKFIEQNKLSHESKLTGYAWWDELAEAVKTNNKPYITTSFVNDATLPNDFDVVELLNGNMHHYASFIDKKDYIAYYNAQPNVLEMTLKKQFMKQADQAVKDTQQKVKENPIRSSWPSLTKPIAWHYICNYKGKARLITVSPLCNNIGYPETNGIMILGTNIDKLLQNAQAIIPAKITVSTTKNANKSQLAIRGLAKQATYYFTMIPQVQIKNIASVSLYIFILIQVILSVIIFSIISPYFTRKYTKHLQETIDQRTSELQKSNQSLQDSLSTVKMLSGLLPICSNCQKIRDDGGYWEKVDVYIRDHSEVKFSHGMCPDCAEELYGLEKDESL